MQLTSQTMCSGGHQAVYSHDSTSTATPMRFALFLPPQAQQQPVPLLWWLSGLTCTENNFMHKAGAQRYAAELGLALVAPDTSPRGAGIDGEDDDDDFGTGAGFYLDAEADPWAAHYRMFSYISEELPMLLAAEFPMLDMHRQSISGHSMGGLGALIMALRNPDRYRSVSAFAPICHPTACPWGEKAFSRYLGADRDRWARWDPVELVLAGQRCPPILVDQGANDAFLTEGQLQPQALQNTCKQHDQPLTLHLRDGYDHSYFFIASFIGEHLSWHKRALYG